MSNPLQEIQAEISQAVDSAFKSAKGGDEKWNSVLENYSVKPLTENQKEALLNSSMKISTGAFPIELRWVILSILHKHAGASANSVEVMNFINSYGIDAEVMKYYNKIKPFGGLGDIFKNAKTSTKNYSEGIGEAKKSAIRCKNCGAPRLDTMQYDECMFCGSELFETT